MNEPAAVPITAGQVTLETEFDDALRLADRPPFRAVMQQLADALDAVGVQARLEETGGDEVCLAYRCTVEQALLLGYDRRRPDELLDAVLREYPWLMPERRKVAARLRRLRADAARRLDGRRERGADWSAPPTTPALRRRKPS